jgi:hypothetical protein
MGPLECDRAIAGGKMTDEEKAAWHRAIDSFDLKAELRKLGRHILAKLERETPIPPGIYPMSGYEVLDPTQMNEQQEGSKNE